MLTFEKLTPKLETHEPGRGREAHVHAWTTWSSWLKSVAKTALLFLLGWLVVKSALPQIVALARSPDLPVQAIGGCCGA